MLLDRLWYDGKIQKILRIGGYGSTSIATGTSSRGNGYYAGSRNMKIESSDDDDYEEDDAGENRKLNMWMYKAIKNRFEESCWADIPCGKCPVANFCTEDGPVNPRNCKYFQSWLSF